jgi:heme A synthase
MRPYWTIGHLANTFLLLAALTATAWFASTRKRIVWPADKLTAVLLAAGLLAILVVGASGSLAALSNMFHPSGSIAEGVTEDFAETSPALVRLRISHPILSIITGVFLIFLAGWARNSHELSAPWAKYLSILVILQLVSGAATLLLHAPIVMQLIHLFLADAIWIVFILMLLEVLSSAQPPEALSTSPTP